MRRTSSTVNAKRLRAALAVAALLTVLAPRPLIARDDAYFRYRMPQDPPTLDPLSPPDESSGLYFFNIFDGLVEFSPGGLDVVPAVAESWKLSADGTTYTFKLRKGVRFHNGRAVVAADVVYSLKRGLSPKKGSRVVSLLDTIKGATAFAAQTTTDSLGVEAPDPATVIITLERPFAPFLAALASVAGSIMPSEVYDDPNKAYLAHPVGCGPFQFESWDRGVSIRLSAFKQHWKGAPAIPGLTFRFLPDVATAFEEFKTGGLEYDNEAPPGRRAWVRENLAAEYRVWPRIATSFVAFNFLREPLKGNAKLRRALNFAIDRDRIARVLQEGKDVATSRILPPGLLGHNPAPGPYRYDSAEAKKLLAEAGFPEGRGLPEIVYLTPNNEAIRHYAEAVQADLAAVGVKVRLNALEFGAYLAAISGTKESGADASMFNFLWYPDLPDPDGFLRVLFHSSNFGDLGNYARYANPEVDKLLDEGRAELDPEKREAIYRKAEDSLLADACCIPLYFQSEDGLLSTRVKGFVNNPFGDFATHLELIRFGP